MVVRWALAGLLVVACGGESVSRPGGSGNEHVDDGVGGSLGTDVPSTGGSGAMGHGLAGAPWLGPLGGSGGRSGETIVAGGGFGGTALAAGGIGQGRCDYPPVFNSPSPWVDAERELIDEFEAVRDHIPGRWRGIVTTPWVPPYDVSIEFGLDGRYSATCDWSSDDCCTAFYYGTDADCDVKRFVIDDVSLAGNVTGDIDIGFAAGGSECTLPGWQGELERLAIDANLDRLRFDFHTSDGYGPLHFELERELPQLK